MATMTPKAAIAAIEQHGILLVYPIDNRKEPHSLWSVFYPRTPMRWEWDQNGDDRVAKLWHMREQLSSSGRVIYAKWYQGRATLISLDLFVAMLALTGSSRGRVEGLSEGAKSVLAALELDSPLSTKELKEAVGLRGKSNEARYTKALKELWERLLIVGYGERDDGAFPSLLVGAAKYLFEDLWEASRKIDLADARRVVDELAHPGSLFGKQFAKFMKSVHAPSSVLDLALGIRYEDLIARRGRRKLG